MNFRFNVASTKDAFPNRPAVSTMHPIDTATRPV